jgi:hypothetical protein
VRRGERLDDEAGFLVRVRVQDERGNIVVTLRLRAGHGVADARQ